MGEYLLPSSFTFRATSIPSPQRFSCFHFFLLDRDHSVAAETYILRSSSPRTLIRQSSDHSHHRGSRPARL